jgi:hypothetical protein
MQKLNMKQPILILIFYFAYLTSYGQTWENVGGGLNDKVYDLLNFDNKLYAGGRIGVKYWDGSTWTGLPGNYGISFPLTLAVFNDTLHVGGDRHISGTISRVYKYNGISWVQVGGDFDEASWSSTKRLLNYNGQLISGGRFSSINGATIYNIASWNGITWNSLGNGLNDCVWNLAEHNGQLFASGDFTASGTDTTVYRIAKWDGLSWSPIDTAHRFKFAGPMISFNGSLIIGNVWDTISGIQMKGIAVWDGTTFTSRGSNLLSCVNNFWTFNNELYLSGQLYTLNPNDYANVILKWNGFFWQQVGLEFDQPILTVDDYSNQLFCGGFYTSPASYISKLNASTGISEQVGQVAFQFYPNPTTDNCIFMTTETGTLTIINQLGEIIRTFRISDYQTLIETSELNSGIYFLSFHSNKGYSASKLIIE